jgi:RNA recognition motif-containing protein
MKNLFVGNLPFRMSEADMSQGLRALFEGFGTVERVSIITDRETGKPRGFAFVEMEDDDAAAKAVAGLNGTEFEGRPLNVSEARPRMDREGGGMGRGGGGGRRSGGGGGDWRGGSSGGRSREPRW